MSGNDVNNNYSSVIEQSLPAIRKQALTYAEKYGLKLFAIDPVTRNGSFYNGHSNRRQWEADFAGGKELGVSAIMSDMLLGDLDIHGPEDAAEAWEHYTRFCAERRLTDAQGNVPQPYGLSKSDGMHFAFRAPPWFKEQLRKGHHKFKISDFRDLKPGEKDRERLSIRWRALNVYAGSARNGGIYRLTDNPPAPHAYGPNTAGLFEWFASETVGQKEKTEAPPTEECTQSDTEVAKLERFVRELMLKDPQWFDDRDNRLLTVWGIKRAGFGLRGYEIARIICDVTEDEKGGRLDRYWYDSGADAGTKTLDSFWKHCANKGIKQTPAEKAEWKKDEMSKAIGPHIAGLQGMQSTAPAMAVPMVGGQHTPLPEHGNLTAPQAYALEDFVAYRPASTFCYLPTREMWGANGVNSKVGKVTVNCAEMTAAVWLSQNIGADAMAWCPGEPTLIKDRLLVEGGWIEKIGDSTLNTYRPATIEPCAGNASLWLDHIKTIFPDDWQHIVNWLAHRVQRPGEKINHALVLGGEPGIGKDTLLEPIKATVGAWNFCDVSPANVMGRFNSHLKSIVLRISEVHDLGDIDRFAFYDKTKTLCAAPPDTHRIDEKHMREYQAVNVSGIIMTTNHKAGGLYLPPDDRRHYVAWSPTPTGFFTLEYFDVLYRWFRDGGNEIVAHYLATLDISAFNAKATPTKTPAFWEIVQSARSPESTDVEDALDALGRPDAVTLAMLEFSPGATPEFRAWMGDRKNGVKIMHRMADAGYEPIRNPDATDGRWRIGGKRRTVYGRRTLSKADQLALAATIVRGPTLPPPSPMVQLPPPAPMLQLPPPPF